MILRAIFWIGLVSLLMPHGPDLGLGRPGAGASLSSKIAALAAPGLPKPDEQCSTACAGSLGAHKLDLHDLGVLSVLENASGRSLAEVKAEIDHSIQARRLRHTG
jgi:hypothetical protein